MKPFPVITSTLSAHHLGHFLQQQYNFSENATCSLLKTGINHSYLVTHNDVKYVFRIYSFNWRTENEIAEEIRLLNLLKENNIPVSFPIKDSNANYMQQLNAPEGIRFAVLFSFAKGEKLLNFPAETHQKIGEIMARMHRQTLGLKLERVTYSSKVMLMDPFEQLKKFLPSATAEMDFMVSTQQYLLKEFENIDNKEVRHGAVHLDIWFDNISIDSEEGVTIFDFDFCGNGMLCLDLAYYILQLNSTEKDETECRLKTDAFLAGYESITPISAEEKRIIRCWVLAFTFFISAYNASGLITGRTCF